jgi:hypothetical protein
MIRFTALHLNLEERAPDTYWIRQAGHRPGKDGLDTRTFYTLPGLELRVFGHPALSRTPHRLRYRGSYKGTVDI